MTGASGADVSTVLDEAYDRMHFSGFELPNGFVNHGPMACEALAALGCEDEIDSWARRFASAPGRAVEPVAPRSFKWSDALGNYERLGEWIGYFDARIADDGWPAVVREWVPRLVPGLAVVLFHGEIRVAHAVRAIDAADTESRRAELARSLGYWAARYRAGEPVDSVYAGDLDPAILETAAEAARRYLARPDIFNLHGVTGAMALALLVPHLTDSDTHSGFAQLRADHGAFFGDTHDAASGSISFSSFPSNELARAAAASGDPHQVKLVEACLRGFESTGDAVFATAAATVTRLP